MKELPAAIRALARGESIRTALYEAALNHPESTSNDMAALRRCMYGNAQHGDKARLNELANYIEEAAK